MMKTASVSISRQLARIGLIATAAFLLAMPMEALAHARLVKSLPKDGDSAKAPEKIELWFSELLDGGFNSIVVFPVAEIKEKKHTNLAKGDAKVDAKDRTHLSVELKALPPGEYVVDWRVLSLDGHSAPGRFKFKVPESK